jgi:hypothetical protein
MKAEFIKNLQGKDFVLFPGLLDLAHEKGLESINTLLLQFPSENNGWSAIVQAVVVINSKSWSAIGDASPMNVGKNIAPHNVRMAETRAIARCLRFALNIGATSLEELGEMPHQDSVPAPQQSFTPSPASSKPQTSSGGPEASEKQIKAIWAICNTKGINSDQICTELVGKPLKGGLTNLDARKVIDHLNGGSK